MKNKWQYATCCFEQILEAASHKTAAVGPLTFYLNNHSYIILCNRVQIIRIKNSYLKL